MQSFVDRANDVSSFDKLAKGRSRRFRPIWTNKDMLIPQQDNGDVFVFNASSQSDELRRYLDSTKNPRVVLMTSGSSPALVQNLNRTQLLVLPLVEQPTGADVVRFVNFIRPLNLN